ncbi:MAG: twin-arginine translocation signal domain-containing protein [Chloroflexi bacterium]|nr:twin-arginine translocation signal domain-containing protein [Chloroflexota bacterium]
MQVTVSSTAIDLSRRDFLKQVGNAGLSLLGITLLNRLGVMPVPSDPRCPCTQTYQHYETRCGTFGCTYSQRKHHVWTRRCESCYCGCGSSCRTAWGNGVYSCVVCGYVCDSITPNCGCACSYCNPCACSSG